MILHLLCHPKRFSNERVLGSPNENPDGKFFDLNMMVQYAALERTHQEFRAVQKLTSSISLGRHSFDDEWIPTCADCGSSRKRAAPMFEDHVWQRLAEPHE